MLFIEQRDWNNPGENTRWRAFSQALFKSLLILVAAPQKSCYLLMSPRCDGRELTKITREHRQIGLDSWSLSPAGVWRMGHRALRDGDIWPVTLLHEEALPTCGR